MNKWKIHQDRDPEDPELNSYSITLNGKRKGWKTDSGYDGYGLPKELAEWICDVLNEHGKNCPFRMSDFGQWENNNK